MDEVSEDRRQAIFPSISASVTSAALSLIAAACALGDAGTSIEGVLDAVGARQGTDAIISENMTVKGGGDAPAALPVHVLLGQAIEEAAAAIRMHDDGADGRAFRSLTGAVEACATLIDAA